MAGPLRGGGGGLGLAALMARPLRKYLFFAASLIKSVRTTSIFTNGKPGIKVELSRARTLSTFEMF